MPSTAGDRYSIQIGGDASAPVVAGRGNRVEMRQAQPDAQGGDVSIDGRQDRGPGPTQTNTANDHGTAFTVMNGVMHIHHDGKPGTTG